LLAGGLLALVAAGGWRMWSDLKSVEPNLPGRPQPPALVKRGEEVAEYARAALADRAAPDDSPAHPLADVPNNPPPDLAAFRIAEDHRVYDLRGWRPVGPDDGPHTAAVVMTRRLKLTKVAAADRIDFLTRTSGSDLVVRVVEPRPEAARVFASQAKPLVSGRPMVEQRLSADVSQIAVGAPFELTFRTTYWNSLQTPDEQWFGTIGYDGSTLLSMLLLFPEARPFKGGGLQTGPAGGELQPYDGTQMVFKGDRGAWMYWEVPGPKTGHIYRVDWRW
jgi:hypothetical protein